MKVMTEIGADDDDELRPLRPREPEELNMLAPPCREWLGNGDHRR